MKAAHLQTPDSCAACDHRGATLLVSNLELVTCKHCLKHIEVLNRAAKPRAIPLPWSPRLFYTKVAGVTHSNEDGTDRQSIVRRCRPGEELSLVREPDHPLDPHGAVKVLRANGEQIGYIPAHVTRQGENTGLAPELDYGKVFKCRVSEITGHGFPTMGVNLQITDGDEWPGQIDTLASGRLKLSAPKLSNVPLAAFTVLTCLVAGLVFYGHC